MIFTDDYFVYDYLPCKRHREVNHTAEEWVNGNVHTNTVEGVWSLFKRSLVGSYHKVSVKHLPAYLERWSSVSTDATTPFCSATRC